MELVEGESLDTVIAPGGLPLARFFEIAVPFAEALSAAHERGIVHRDLKPGNVMVTPEGRVKVLDFGLAKVEAAESNPNLTSTPTQSRADLTSQGQVFGTVAYMSPEQTRGSKVDARSDVFSLGIVLYQMLTGERPFQGGSAVDLISSILRDRPPSVSELRVDLPPHLARIVRRCLEKDPRDRYQTSRDVYNELKELRAEASSATPAAAAVAPRPESRPPVRHDSGSARTQTFWIAVLPFTHSGGDPEMQSFAEGLAEDIHAGLAKFPYLSVISRNSTLRFQTQSSDVRTMARQLGARYVLEGGIRKSGSVLRVHVQLVDAETGAHLWAETYNRDLASSDVLAVQDDVTDRVVATVADTSGALVRSMAASVEEKPDAELTASDVVLRHWRYQHRGTPAEHARVRDGLEKFVEREPGYADVWACLARLYVHEFALGFNPRPLPLDRALRAAQRAVDLDPTCQHARAGIAQIHFFRREVSAFRAAAEHAIALNPRDTDTLGVMGNMLTDSGDFVRGPHLVRRAMELNPHFPDWFRFALTAEHFQKADYAGALDQLARVNMPGFVWKPLWIAACAALAGRHAEAAAAVEESRRVDPDIERSARALADAWLYASGLGEKFLEGLQKAGLEIPAEGEPVPPASERPRSSPPISGVARADEGFRIAVLPFKAAGNDASLTALAEGLTEEILTGLSRFSYLRVVSHHGTAGAGAPLPARYVMEGSLRQAGSQLRIAVQLIDTSSGAHLWAENYERAFLPKSLFEIQDDLVPRIVSTVADMNGVLPRSLSDSVRSRPPEVLSPYEAVLRSFRYMQRVTPEELTAARSGLESAVRKAPEHADAWAMLALLCLQDYGQGFHLRADSLASGSAAARRAVDAAPSNALAQFSLAQAFFFQKDFESFRNTAERAIELNPLDGNSLAFLGELMVYAGESERGLALSGRAKQLNPHHPGWYWYTDSHDAYRRGDFRAALGFARRANLPDHWGMHAAMAAALGKLGEREAAAKAIGNLLRLRPNFAANVRSDCEKWWQPEFVESFLDGLRKAGLEIPAEGPARERPASSPPVSGAARADEGFWVAVLPFHHSGGDAGLATLAEGMTDEIVTGLSRFSYLRVISRASTRRYASGADDVRAVGTELGARYVIDGSLRQQGSALRISAQLVDASTGAHLWAETYNCDFQADKNFELQDDVVSRIVATVGDAHGILPHAMSESLRGRAPAELTPYEAVLRSFGFGYRSTEEEHAVIRDGLERAVATDSSYADAWAMLSLIHTHEYAHEFNQRPDSLERALQAARRASDAAPSNAMAFDALAWALYFLRDIPAFRVAADTSIALNPLNSPTLAGLGTLIAYAGDWEKGCALVERAVQLNPRHPGWYRFALYADAYRTKDYERAAKIALQLNLPEFYGTHEVLAAAYGQLGKKEEARRALADLLRLKPDYPATGRARLEKWYGPELVEHWMDGLRKAGLETAAKGSVAAPAPERAPSSPPVSGAARADEGFWVAVLPFHHSGADAGLAALAEGMTDEIVTGLSRFSYLRVISRASTRRYASGADDVRAVGTELGARYVMDGSLRLAGSALRISVQLIDAVSGAHLWAETYNRDNPSEATFALQDDVVRRIVSTVADTHGILPHSMSEVLRGKNPEELTPYEAVLRGLSQVISVSAEQHASVRAGLERAVQDAPGYADAWALLSDLYREEYAHGFNLRPDPLGRALAAARRAVEIAPSNHLAQGALATAHFLRREFPAFRSAAERAIELNPMDGFTMAYLGSLVAYSGDWERGCAMAKQARELNPQHPSWYWFSDCFNAYRQGDYRAALDIARRIQMPGFWRMNLALAATHGQLGDRDEAAAALRELLAAKPQFASRAREELSKWWNADFVEKLLDGLRKAGLDARAAAAAPAPVPAPGVLAETTAPPKRRGWIAVAAAAVVLGAAALWFARSQSRPAAPPQSGAAPSAIRSLAVLPLDNYSGDASQDYFAEGMTDELTSRLANISSLRVISRGSAMQFKGKTRPPTPEIAKKLDVDAVVEGSVMRSGDKVRITAQLIDARSDRHLWAKSFEKSSKDVLALQDELSSAIASEIHVQLTPAEQSRRAKERTVNPEAYDAYLKGRYFFNRPSDENLNKAIEKFEEATRLDPNFAPAYSGLSDAVLWAAFNEGVLTASEAKPRAKAAAEKAIALDADSAEAHTSLATYETWFEYDWSGSHSEYRRAIALNPNYAFAHDQFGLSLAFQGRLDEAIAEGKRATELDPLSPQIPIDNVMALAFKQDFRAAKAEAARSATLDPTFFFAPFMQGWIELQAGKVRESVPWFEKARSLESPPFVAAWLGYAYGAAGEQERARAMIEEVGKSSLRGYVPPFNLALIHLGLGDREKALDGLEKAYAADSQWLIYVRGDRTFDPLRSEPRFVALLKKLGFEK